MSFRLESQELNWLYSYTVRTSFLEHPYTMTRHTHVGKFSLPTLDQTVKFTAPYLCNLCMRVVAEYLR